MTRHLILRVRIVTSSYIRCQWQFQFTLHVMPSRTRSYCYYANGEGRLIVGFAFPRRFLYLNHEAAASTDSRSEMPVKWRRSPPAGDIDYSIREKKAARFTKIILLSRGSLRERERGRNGSERERRPIGRDKKGKGPGIYTGRREQYHKRFEARCPLSSFVTHPRECYQEKRALSFSSWPAILSLPAAGFHGNHMNVLSWIQEQTDYVPTPLESYFPEMFLTSGSRNNELEASWKSICFKRMSLSKSIDNVERIAQT